MWSFLTFVLASNFTVMTDCHCFRFHSSPGVSRDDYLKFFHFLNNINDVDTALTFYHIAGASIDQGSYFLELRTGTQ